MFNPTTKEVLDSFPKQIVPIVEPLDLPRGLLPPTPQYPVDLVSTPGVTDSAERAAQRAQILSLIRKQEEELPVAVADQAFRGAIAGCAVGIGFSLLRMLCRGSSRSKPEYQDEGDGDE